MAGLKDNDCSPSADAFLLAALFLPFIPVVAVVYAGALSTVLGCSAVPTETCIHAGIDFNRVYAGGRDFLHWSTRISASGPLLIYLALLGLLAQWTTRGLRERIVRTFAVIMWAGVVPLLLGLANTIVRTPETFCGGRACTAETALPTFVHLSHAVSEWFANNAIPLAVLVTLLVVLTMGYRWIVKTLVRVAVDKWRGDTVAARPSPLRRG